MQYVQMKVLGGNLLDHTLILSPDPALILSPEWNDGMLLWSSWKEMLLSSGLVMFLFRRCPTRKQNYDYIMYLLKVLYLESNVSISA